jgi:hypothetical protein
LATLLGGALAFGLACGDDDADEHTGQSCDKPEVCYPEAKQPLKGTAVCLDRVMGGYCTHTCQTDADCCAVEGECKSGYPQVCSPFESTGAKYCFLSCEAAVVTPTGKDESAYCHEFAHQAFNCRSSGGGSENRKVCVPGG